MVAGEISTETYVDIPRIARETLRRIGYNRAKYGFDAETCSVITAIDEQSPDIAQGVDTAYEARTDPNDEDELDRIGAGDQGMMFGYATRETRALMPMPIQIAHTIAHRLAEVRKAEVIPYLRPDGKTQVTVRYENDRPVEIVKLLISTQHKPDIDGETLIKPDLWEHVVEPVLHEEYKELFTDKELYESFLVNPTGKFEIGGPHGRLRAHRAQGDRRHLRRRRSPRRWLLLRQGPLQGGPLGRLRRPLRGQERGRGRARRSVRGPGRLRDRRRPPGVADGRDLRHREASRLRADRDRQRGPSTCAPGAIVRDLDLRRPIFQKTAAYGHFGRTDHDFTWERTDRVEALRAAAGLEGAAAEAGATADVS